MATNLYGGTSITGGASGSLDSLVYSTLADGDIAFVCDSTETFFVFRWESSSTTNESSPWTTNKVVEADDDAGAATGRWVLCSETMEDATVYGDLSVTGTLTLSGSLSTAGFTSTGDITMGDGTTVTFDVAPASDHNIAGISAAFTAGESLVFGDFCYYKADGKMWKVDADGTTTMPCVAMAAATIAGDASGDFLTYGWARDDTWAWTVGALLYADTTAGDLTETQPSGSGDQVQAVALATHADRIYFNPALTMVEVTA
jgi:hypothetical protein